MSKSKNKFITRYSESDLATLITDQMLNVQTPEGAAFKSLHTLPNVVAVRVGNQTFLISITEKKNLS